LACMALLLAALLVAKLPLVVRVYDTTGVSASRLELARADLSQTLTAIGIEPIWRPCHAAGCTGRPQPHEVLVRIVKSGPFAERDSLGYSSIDIDQHAGTLATIYADRVFALASQGGIDGGVLLGRAIAHEIGHLLLGAPGHGPQGLMRALWRMDELQRDRSIDWRFSPHEGGLMRRHLMARAALDPAADAVVADVAVSAPHWVLSSIAP
jgi:hypothetical protein